MICIAPILYGRATTTTTTLETDKKCRSGSYSTTTKSFLFSISRQFIKETFPPPFRNVSSIPKLEGFNTHLTLCRWSKKFQNQNTNWRDICLFFFYGRWKNIKSAVVVHFYDGGSTFRSCPSGCLAIKEGKCKFCFSSFDSDRHYRRITRSLLLQQLIFRKVSQKWLHGPILYTMIIYVLRRGIFL